MSLRTIVAINTVFSIVVVIGLLFALLALLAWVGALDSTAISIVGLTAMIVIPAFVLMRGARQRRQGEDARRHRGSGFGMVTRLHHFTEQMPNEQARLALDELGLPVRSTVLWAHRCQECGHEEFVLKTDGDEPYFISRGFPPESASVWLFGVFAIWSNRTPIPLEPRPQSDPTP